MPIKEYFRPQNLSDASELLTTFAVSARVLAGGTDLLVQTSEDKSPEIQAVSLRDVEKLKEIKPEKEHGVFIGAMVNHADVATSPLIKENFPALAKASSLVGSPSIRNLGTIGGNICNASPSADSALPLLTYEAKALVWNSSGEKEINIEDFFTGPQMNILETGEILKGFFIKPNKGIITTYEKLGIRKAMEIAIVNVCVTVKIDDSKQCSHVCIALGAVAPTPIRARKAELILKNQNITAQRIKEAAQAAIGETKPISDIRASAGYRKEMVGIMVEKTLSNLAG